MKEGLQTPEQFAASLFTVTNKGLIPDLLRFTVALRTIFQPITFNRTIYICDNETKLYRENKGEIQAQIQSLAQLAGYDKPLEYLKRELVGRLRDDNVVAEYPFNKFNGFPVGNGVVVFGASEKISLIDYACEMMFTRKIPINYNPNADPEQIIKILESWVEKEDVIFLIQIAAQAIVQSLPNSRPFKKAYLLSGDAHGGKTTFLDFIKLVFGENNISRLKLHQLWKRFNLSSLEGVFINMGDDIPNEILLGEDVFKTLLGERNQFVEVKGKALYSTDITAVHIYTCNRPPEINLERAGNPFWERWIIVEFPFEHPRVSNWVDDNLTQENMEAFLLLSIITASKMIRSGKLEKEQDTEDVIIEWQHNSSPINDFIDEHLEKGDKKFSVLKDELLDALIDYSKSLNEDDKKRIPADKTALSKKLREIGIAPSRARLNKQRCRVYVGVKWKSDSPYSKKFIQNSKLS